MFEPLKIDPYEPVPIATLEHPQPGDVIYYVGDTEVLRFSKDTLYYRKVPVWVWLSSYAVLQFLGAAGATALVMEWLR